MREFCECDPCDQRHVVDADDKLVCLNCWWDVDVNNLKVVPVERRSQFRDQSTWTPEFRAGVLAALDIRNRMFLAQCEDLYNKSST